MDIFQCMGALPKWNHKTMTVTLSTDPRFFVASMAKSFAQACNSTFLLILVRTKFTACCGVITSHKPSVAMIQNSVWGVHTSLYTSGTAITGPAVNPPPWRVPPPAAPVIHAKWLRREVCDRGYLRGCVGGKVRGCVSSHVLERVPESASKDVSGYVRGRISGGEG